MNVTKNIKKYILDLGINLSELARKTNVSYFNLYNSLSKDGERELKADELMMVCYVLHLNPMDYCDFATESENNA